MTCSSCGKSASNRVGSTINTAIVFGEPEPQVYRAKVVGDIPSLQTGAIKFVRGSMVQQLVDEGKLSILAGSVRTLPQTAGFTLYYVGDTGYTTIDAARVKSGQTGQEIEVRTFGQ